MGVRTDSLEKLLTSITSLTKEIGLDKTIGLTRGSLTTLLGAVVEMSRVLDDNFTDDDDDGDVEWEPGEPSKAEADVD